MGIECTVQDHIAEVIATAQRAYKDGRREGVAIGHEAGQIAGYTAGHHDGACSTTAYQVAAQNEWINGYLTRISDEVAIRGEAA